MGKCKRKTARKLVLTEEKKEEAKRIASGESCKQVAESIGTN
jgi:DNA-binding CsgD family transcriptional regulator